MIGRILQQLAALPPWVDWMIKLTTILAFGWVVQVLLHRCNPRWRVALWRGLALGLILAPALTILAPPLLRIAVERPAAAPAMAPASEFSKTLAPAQPRVALMTEHNSNASPVVMPAIERAPHVDWIGHLRGHGRLLLTALWTLVAAGLALRLVRSWRAVRRIVKVSAPAPDSARKALDSLAVCLGCRHVPALRISAVIPAPFLCGAFRPVIILPEKMAAPDYCEELPAILAHELSHTRSRDVLWGGLLHARQVALWFHPLAWRMRAAHAAACEEVCDAVAAGVVGDAISYSGTLARVALEMNGVGLAALGGLPMARAADVRRRIEILKGKIYSMPIARRWLALAAVAGLLVVSGIAGLRLVQAEPQPAGVVIRKGGDPRTITLKGRVVTEDGKPLPRGGFELDVHGATSDGGQFSTLFSAKSDGTFTGSTNYATINLACRVDGYAVAEAGPFRAEPGETIENIRIVLKRGFPGRIQAVDPSGRPIAGAKFTGYFNYFSPAWGHSLNWTEKKPLQADARGVAVIAGISTLTLNLEGNAHGFEEEQWRELRLSRDSTATLTIRPAKVTEGVIVEAATGKPVAGARLHLGQKDGGLQMGWVDAADGPVLATSDAAGRFRLDTLRADTQYYFMVEADGFRRELPPAISAGQQGLRIELRPRLYVRGKVLGPDFAEKNGRTPFIRYRQSVKVGRFHVRAKGEADLKVTGGIGRFEIDRLWAGELEITAGNQSKTLNLTAPLDDLTIDLQPKAEDKNGGSTESAQITASMNQDSGKRENASQAPLGNQPARLSATLTPAPQPTKRTLAGVALGADGKPAAGAEVVLCLPDKDGMPYEFAGSAVRRQGAENYLQGARIITTGADGKFEFQPYSPYFVLVVRHGSGVAIENENTFPSDGNVKVHPWGRVEGVLKEGRKVIPNQRVRILSYVPRHNIPLLAEDLRPYPEARYEYTALSDDQGRFVFERIHSGQAEINMGERLVNGKKEYSPWLPLEIKPEGITFFNLGGMGRVVKGKVVLGEGSAPDYNVADSCMIYLRPFMPHIPSEVFKTRGGYEKWHAGWEQTPEGKTVKAMKGYSRSVRPDKDGSFSISDVPEGKYRLSVEAHVNNNTKPPASMNSIDKIRQRWGGLLDATIREFDILPMPGRRSDQPLDLGWLEVVASTGPNVGDPAPDFTCETLDGKQLSFKDYRGKCVLLIFWTKNNGPYAKESATLKAVWQKFGQHPDFSMISLSMDSDKSTPAKFARENGLDWSQCYLGNRGDNKTGPKYGVYAHPEIILIGTNGRVIQRGLAYDSVEDTVAAALSQGSNPRAEKSSSNQAAAKRMPESTAKSL